MIQSPPKFKLLIQRCCDGYLNAQKELAKLIEEPLLLPVERNIKDYFTVEEVTEEQIKERKLNCLN